MPQSAALSPVMSVVWVVLGILLSLTLPIAVKTLRGTKGTEARGLPKPTLGQKLAEAWANYGGSKYLRILVAATVVAFVVVFLVGGEFKSVKEAVLAGFAWEGFLNKLPK